MSLIKIRTLASAGVPLSQIGQLLEAGAPAFADESDPRMKRFRELMRERGWARWIRPERVAERPGLDRPQEPPG